MAKITTIQIRETVRPYHNSVAPLQARETIELSSHKYRPVAGTKIIVMTVNSRRHFFIDRAFLGRHFSCRLVTVNYRHGILAHLVNTEK